jgi:ABC-type microcin C transport system duplicated ATPase subunit YejF
MADGKILEFGETGRVLTEPEQMYTKRLLADTPSITAAAALT